MNAENHNILLLGLGNEIMGDDAVGLLAVRQLREVFQNQFDVIEAQIAGLALLDLMQGYDKVLLLDSIATGKSPPGSIRELSGLEFQENVTYSPHYAGFEDVLQLAKLVGIPMPSEIRILTIEVHDPFVLREGLTPSIGQQLGQFVGRAQSILQDWGYKAQFQR
jgi:hydrogenase maturation protease